MLEQIDLAKKLEKSQFQPIVADLEVRLGELQRAARTLQIPTIILFEGWDAAGKGTIINRLMQTFDPRGCVVLPIHAPNEGERLRPFLWRFWLKTPAQGRIAVFDQSWYGRVLTERVERQVSKATWRRAYDEIRSFERQLTDDGALLIKFFLHISQAEQKKRLEKLADSPVTSWKVTDDEWQRHEQYDLYLKAAEAMLARTDSDYAPWTVVEAHDKRFATVKVFHTVVTSLEQKIARTRQIAAAAESRPPVVAVAPEPPANEPDNAALAALSSSILDKIDLSLTLDKSAYDQELKICQQRIFELEHEIYRQRVPVVIVYEGCDAAGKGGNIRRLTQSMDPRGYEVTPIAAPNDVEKSHHYLWRFWQAMPKAGHITIFDRSWYGRVLVERVEGFCAEAAWKRAYREINDMEAQLVNFGAVVIKFWLQIDQDEQLRRFTERQQDTSKQWKITSEDWRNRDKWLQYKAAIDDMLLRTSTTDAPWTIIEANSKYYARMKALQTVIASIEAKLHAKKESIQ